MLARLTVACLLLTATTAARADAPGSIKGTVIFEGEAPERPKINRDADPYCNRVDRLVEDVIVTKGKLKDVLVRIKNGTAGTHTAPAKPAVIDQFACMYAPRVIGIVAGQKLQVRNSDGTYHNVHATVDGKLLWNKPMSEGDPDLTLDGPKAGQIANLTCDVHGWMKAYAVVQDHPFFAVTGEDGSFEIKGLTPGTYTLEAWHPNLGMKSMTVKIGVGPLAAVTARFSYKPGDK